MFQLQICCTSCGAEVLQSRSYFCDRGLYCNAQCHDQEGEAHSCGRGVLRQKVILETIWNSFARQIVLEGSYLRLAPTEGEVEPHLPQEEGTTYRLTPFRGERVLPLPRALIDFVDKRLIRAMGFEKTHVIVHLVWLKTAQPGAVFLFKEELVAR